MNRETTSMGAWVRRALVVVGILASGCRTPPKDAAAWLNPAGCAPLNASSLAGYALREGAPLLDLRWRYRCVAFEAEGGRPTEITVFAEGFHPELYLIDPAARSQVIAWSRTGPGAGSVRIARTLARGTYLAVITTIDEQEAGSFLISIQGLSFN